MDIELTDELDIDWDREHAEEEDFWANQRGKLTVFDTDAVASAYMNRNFSMLLGAVFDWLINAPQFADAENHLTIETAATLADTIDVLGSAAVSGAQLTYSADTFEFSAIKDGKEMLKTLTKEERLANQQKARAELEKLLDELVAARQEDEDQGIDLVAQGKIEGN